MTDSPTDPATTQAPRRPLLLLAVAAVVVAVDQAAKEVAVATLEGQRSIALLGDWLMLRVVRNPGAAFSMGADVTWVFTTIQLVFVIGVVVLARRVTGRLPAVALGLIAGGAAGNLVDRLGRSPGFFHGHVVDFVSVRGFAVFNLADAAITIGVILLAAWILFTPENRGAHA